MPANSRRAAIVIAFDHLPVGFLGCYGAEQVATPRFNRIASGSITFDFCFARRTTITTPAHDAESDQTPEDVDEHALPGETLWSTLQATLERDGIRSTYRHESAPASEEIPSTPEDLPLANLLEDSHDFLAGHLGESSLLWLQARGVPDRYVPLRNVPIDVEGTHGIDAGDPAVAPCLEALYRLQDPRRADDPVRHVETLVNAGLLQRGRLPQSPGLDRLNRALYAASVKAIDACLTSVLDALDVPPERQPLLIIVGMQGDCVSRHPQLEKGCPPLVDEIVHVPLIVRPPGGLALGQRSRALVQTDDIVATVHRWLAPETRTAPSPEANDDASRDLLQVYAGESPERTAALLEGPRGCLGLRTSSCSLLLPGLDDISPGEQLRDHARLFRKPEDVRDVLDVAAQEPETVTALCDDLAARRQPTGGAEPVSD